MLLQSLDNLGVDRAPFIGGFFLEVFVNRLRQPEIEPDHRLRKITLFHPVILLLCCAVSKY